MRSRPVIAICLGDPAGVGPEVTLKALCSKKLPRNFDFVIIGDNLVVADTARWLKLKNNFSVVQPTRSLPRVRLGKPNLPAARAAYEWLLVGGDGCLSGKFAAVVNAPVNKATITRAGIPFRGATEVFAKLTRTKRFAMMLASPQLKVSPVTGHIGLRQVSKTLRSERIVEVAELTHETLQRLGIARPRIAIAALNPHAGEHGLFGDEEQRIIEPAVTAVRRKGIAASGPHSGDTIFYRAYHGEFDAVVPMYHDQGLAPFKLIAFDHGVNLTMGLPIVRTSVDHGTAYEIAGKGIARPDSLVAAINLAAQLAR